MDDGASGNVGMALAMRSLEYGYTPGADAALTRASRQGIILQDLVGQQFEIRAVAYSPDGSLIATASEGGTRIYDASSADELRFLPQENLVNAIAFSPDGAVVATGGRDDTVRLWNVATGEEIKTFPLDSDTFFLLMVPDSLPEQVIRFMYLMPIPMNSLTVLPSLLKMAAD